MTCWLALIHLEMEENGDYSNMFYPQKYSLIIECCEGMVRVINDIEYAHILSFHKF